MAHAPLYALLVDVPRPQNTAVPGHPSGTGVASGPATGPLRRAGREALRWLRSVASSPPR